MTSGKSSGNLVTAAETAATGNVYLGETQLAMAWRRLRRDRVAMVGLVLVLLLALVAVLAPWLAPYDPVTDYNLRNRLQPPSKEHWLGTDASGRDVFSRIVHGARISLTVGLTSRVVTLVLGVGLGALAGYFAGTWFDMLVMRLSEVVDALPSLFIAIAIAVAIGPGIYTVFIALGFVGWADMCRLLRGQVLTIRAPQFVEAARAIGCSTGGSASRHILPPVPAPLSVSLTMGTAGAITAQTSLSVLGLGAQPRTPTWASMMSYARQYIYIAPHLVFAPGVAILITVYAFNL